jgi:plastocyanin
MRWLTCFTVLGLALLTAWAVPAEGQAPTQPQGGQPPGTPPAGMPAPPGSPFSQPYYPGMPGLGYPPNPYYRRPGIYGPPGKAPPPQPTSQADVVIYDNYFEPAVVYVTPGGVIRWINQGQHAHTVTGYTRGFDSGDINPGDTYTYRLPRALNYFYYCRHHRLEMNGVIVVRAAPKGRAPYPQPRPGY